MAGICVISCRRVLACLSLLAFLFAADALAQSNPSAPATLRLAQVGMRLPDVHLYANAQTENSSPVAEGQWGQLSTLIGPNYYASVDDVSRRPEPIAIVFLIDISKSLSRQQFQMIKDSVQSWIDNLQPSDQAAIVTLGSSVKTVQNFTADKRALHDALTPLWPSDMQTLLYQGLLQAIDLSRRLDIKGSLPLRRAIVVLTDGIDDQQGGAGRQEVLDKLALDPTPIYGLGASSQNNSKVDAALKDFAGLVRASGGDYKRMDIGRVREGYVELHKIVDSTKHLSALCPPCVPDGSATVVRLFMVQGATRLSSESVTVRSVDPDGNVKPSPSPIPPPQPKPWWKELLDFLAELHPAWKAVLGLLAAGSVAGAAITFSFPDLPKQIVILVWGRKPHPTPEPPKTTKQEPDNSVVQIKSSVLVPYDTRQDKQRLRLYPIGHNEIGPFDLLFEKTLAVGRSPDSEICISNDAQVSANHCALSPQGKSILVQDSGSRNGTRVNGVPINGFLHAEPDSVLGVGRTELRMKLLPVGAR